MNTLEALNRIITWTLLHDMERKKSIAHYWHRLPAEVREAVKDLKSSDCERVALWSIFGDQPARRHRGN